MTTDPVTSAPVAPSQAPDTAAPPAPAPASVAEPNKDLAALSQDLENLAKEAVATTPPSVAPVAAPPVVSAPEPLTVPPTAAPVVAEPEVKETKESKASPITVYTTPSCPFCKAQREFLGSINLAYVDKNVEEDTESLKEMLNVSDNFAGVPVTVLNGPKGKKVVKGFTQDEFVKELEEVGLKEASVEPAKSVAPSAAQPAPAPVVPEVKEPVVAPPAAAPVAPVASAEPVAPAAEAPKVPDLN